VAVLSNHAGCPTGFLAYEVAEVFFSDELEPEQGTDEPEESAGVEVAVALLEAYAGKYMLSGLGLEMEFKLKQGELFLAFLDQPEAKLLAKSDSVFGFADSDATVEFNLDEPGKVADAIFSQGGATYDLVPFEPYKPDPEVLKAYEGRYFSPELDVIYTLEARDTTLVIKLRNTEDIELIAFEEDNFKGDVFFISEIGFERDAGGRVTGFRVSNGRTKGIRFERVL
jgi:hypothetical protein